MRNKPVAVVAQYLSNVFKDMDCTLFMVPLLIVGGQDRAVCKGS